MQAQGQRLSPSFKGATFFASQCARASLFLIGSPQVPGLTLLLPVKGQRFSYGCLVKGMSVWQRQRDHGKCDTCVPLTGWDGRCWQLACQPPLGAWQADRRSGALPVWENKLHLFTTHARTHRGKNLSQLGRRCGFWWGELVPMQVESILIL